MNRGGGQHLVKLSGRGALPHPLLVWNVQNLEIVGTTRRILAVVAGLVGRHLPGSYSCYGHGAPVCNAAAYS